MVAALNQKIAIFDMDRTLIRRGSWAGWLRHWLRHQAPARILLLPLLLVPLLRYRAGKLGRGELKAEVQAIIMGRRVAGERVRAAAARYARHIVSTDLFPGARGALAAARAEGNILVIATASNAYYAQAIGDLLGVDKVIATRHHWQDDHLLPRLDGENIYGEAKANAVQAWLITQNLQSACLNTWSDHISDLPLLELSPPSGGHPTATNPSAALRAEAKARGWPMVDWGEVRASLLERA